MKRINKFVFAKIVRSYPAKLEVSDPITGDLVSKTQSEIEKCENLCGSEKIETTNDVNEDDAPTVSLNYDYTFDLNHENPSYCNSSLIRDRDVFMDGDLEYNDTTIQGEDFKDSEKTIKEESLINNANSLSKDFCSIDSTYEKIRQIKHSGEKFIDSEVSLNVEDDDKIIRQIIDSYVDSRIIAKKSVPCENEIEEEIKDKEMRLEEMRQNITACIENSPRKELDIEDTTMSNLKSNNCYIDNNKSYLKDAVDLLKCAEENMNHTLNIEEDNLERTITEIKEMDKIIKNLLYTNNDEQHDSVEERMIKSLSAELESNHDDVLRKIIENCPGVSTDFQQHSLIRENSTINFEESNSEYISKNFQENKLFSRYRDVSDTAIEKEDILKTIKEAEKILTDNPYPDMSETSVNENCVGDNLLEKFTKEVNDEECKTVSKKENKVENKDTETSLENVKIEKVIVSESNVIDSNLQKLAEITCSDRQKSHIEIHETLEKIAEEKRKIEDRKRNSLETLSKKFEEIDKFIADRYDISYTSDIDPREFKIPENFADDSLDDFQDCENVEVPLTKAEIIENLKIEELEKELANEMEEHKKLMDEYQKIIATDLEEIQQATLESKAEQIYNDEKTDKETAKNQSKNDENISDELNQTPVMINDTTIKIDSESDNSFSEDSKESEKTYVKGKVYDFDEKKHGIR